MTCDIKITVDRVDQIIFLTNTFFVLLVKALIAKRNVIAGHMIPKIQTHTSL